MNLRETKSMLAKLLATENIMVEHGNYRTAAFDPQKRTLYLPIFKWMDGDVYDLLVLHEVSHALHTPADGWHSTGCDKGKGYKSFLNVTEDARIEKKIKRRYPGASKAMTLGYRELMRQDFFGIEHTDIEKLPLIDRINLHTKGGASMGIEFSEKDMVWVDELMKLETFDEIVEFTNRLYDYCAEHESSTDNQDMSMMSDSDYYENDDEDEFNDYDMVGNPPLDGDETDDNSSMNDESAESDDSDEDDDSDDFESGSDSDSENEEQSENSEKESNIEDGNSTSDNNEFEKEIESSAGGSERSVGGYGSEFDGDSEVGPRSITDEYFRDREEDLNEVNEDSSYIYVNLPNPDLDEIIWDYKTVQKEFEEFYLHEKSGYRMADRLDAWETAPKVFKEFRDQNKSIIDYLAKEFEMKKRADEYKRTASANTGMLNTSKLYSYKYSDNLFKRIATVHSGKNHGLVMFIDWSGSMQSNLVGTMEQLLILVMFCRKVQIPYDVYAFTDRLPMGGRKARKRHSGETVSSRGFGEEYADRKPSWEEEPNTLMMENKFNLIQLFSNRMSNIAFNKACWNAINIRDHYTYYRQSRTRCPDIAPIFNLGGTPLNAAITAAHDVIRKFKKDNDIQIVNSVFLTDGDSHSCGGYLDRNNRSHAFGRHDILTIRDRQSKTEIVTNKRFRTRVQTEMLFNSLRKSVGVNIIGFFLVNRINRHSFGTFLPSDGNTSYDDFMTMWRKEKCVVTDIDGYDNLYIIKDGADLQVDGNSELDKVDAGAKKSAIRTAFKKMNRNKLKNRVVLNKFVELIS